MNYSEIIVGHRVLVQSGAETKEHAKVKGITPDGRIIVILSNGDVVDMAPEYILKDFGS